MSNKKSIVVTIRLSEDEIRPLNEAMSKLKIDRSKFFRSVLLNNFDPDKHDKSKTERLDKLLFYYNKSSNNLNQLARAVNLFSLEGGITEVEKDLLINRLNTINEFLKNGINDNK